MYVKIVDKNGLTQELVPLHICVTAVNRHTVPMLSLDLTSKSARIFVFIFYHFVQRIAEKARDGISRKKCNPLRYVS